MDFSVLFYLMQVLSLLSSSIILYIKLALWVLLELLVRLLQFDGCF
jgi:hypothetical protein